MDSGNLEVKSRGGRLMKMRVQKKLIKSGLGSPCQLGFPHDSDEQPNNWCPLTKPQL